jgi:uncharacterized protein
MTAAPARAGIGLRTAHYRDFLAQRPQTGFVEVHSENFFGCDGAAPAGQPRRVLEEVRADYPLSLHGVGLSLGGAEPLQREHLQQLRMLVQMIEPLLVSDHLAWVGSGGVYLNDLLPLPYTEEALAVTAANVRMAQDYLGRQLLIENPSRYLEFSHSTLQEWEFMTALAQRTGCAILLDINNVYVSAVNLGFDPCFYLERCATAPIAEIHLAGFSRAEGLLIDTHSAPVDAAVWALYCQAAAYFADVPVLIEWDAQLPPLAALLEEAYKADGLRAAALAEVERAHVAG